MPFTDAVSLQVACDLTFDGRCEQALECCQRAAGARIELLMRFTDSPTRCPKACGRPATRAR